MRVCLFEDRGVTGLEPLTLTRPCFELLCGQASLGVKQCRFFRAFEAGVLIRPFLADLFRLRQTSAPVNDLDWLRAEPTILVNSRWLPPTNVTPDVTGSCVAMVNDEVAYVVVGPERLTYCSPNTLEDCLETWKNILSRQSAGGRMVHYLWDLVEANAEQMDIDYRYHLTRATPRNPSPALAVVGNSDQLFVHPTAQLDPLIVVDTTHGPVVIDREAVITAFTRLEGPCYIGPHTHLLGAKIRAGTTIGPHCQIGGEVEASIIQGCTNKCHDGFLGHSYIGEWVNLGAGTHNSDLRIDYGPVSVWHEGSWLDTGLKKVGCFIGDHSKTSVGTLFNTGTSVGVFCNLLTEGRLLPRYFPSFSSWLGGAMRDHADLPRLLPIATEVMRRRGYAFTEVHATLYRHLCEQTMRDRHRAVDGSVEPQRRSA